MFVFLLTIVALSQSPIEKSGVMTPNGICDSCKSAIEQAKTLLKDGAVIEDIKKEIYKFCATLPAPADVACNGYVDTYVPLVVDLIESGLETLDICKKIGLCALPPKANGRQGRPSLLPKKIVLPKGDKNSIQCDICKKAVEYIMSCLKDAKVEEEIIEVIDNLCRQYPAPYDTLCLTAVKDYVPIIIKYIEQGLEGVDVCGQISLCSTQQRHQARLVRSNKQQNLKDGDACTICTITINYIDSCVKDSAVEEEIIEKVQAFCSTLSWLYSGICKIMVKSYIPSILQLIDEGLTSLDICHRLKFCDATQYAHLKQLQRIQSTQKVMTPNGICDSCKSAIEQAKTLLKDGAVVEDIKKELYKFCATLPTPVDSLCNGYVDTYVPLVIDLIESGLETLDICKKIGFCSLPPTKVEIAPKKFRLAKLKGDKNSIQCDICKKAVEYIMSCLKDAKVEEEIIEVIDNLCRQYPAPYDTLCLTAVKDYVPIIIKYIEQGLEGVDVCGQISLCSTQQRHQARLVRSNKQQNLKDGDACTICTITINYIDSCVKDSAVEEEIIEKVQAFCSTLSWLYSGICKIMVKSYIPSILQLIDEGLTSLDICHRLKFCDATQVVALRKTPLGRISNLNKRVTHISKIAVPKEADNAFTCEMCTKIVSYVQTIDQEYTVDELIALVKNLCATFPAPYSGICQTVAEKYIPLIIGLIDLETPPVEICKKIGLC